MSDIKHLEQAEHDAWINYQTAQTMRTQYHELMEVAHDEWQDAIVALNTARSLKIIETAMQPVEGQVAGVTKFSDLVGKTIRVKATHSGVQAIGHIVKDDWFCPADDFAQLKQNKEETK